MIKTSSMHTVKTEDKSWPIWAYIIINDGICILAGWLLNFETPCCYDRLDILCSDGSKVDKNEPRDHLTTVSYSKEKDEAVILQGGGNKSAPPSEEVTSDPFLQKLYPCLPRVPT